MEHLEGGVVRQVLVKDGSHVALGLRQSFSTIPGMQAQVMVVTERRTAREYLLSPLIAALDNAFRQG